jgi:hypothetical protein
VRALAQLDDSQRAAIRSAVGALDALGEVLRAAAAGPPGAAIR